MTCVEGALGRNDNGHLGKLIFGLWNQDCRNKSTHDDHYTAILCETGHKTERTETFLWRTLTLIMVMHLLLANEVCVTGFCFRILHLLKSRILSSHSVPKIEEYHPIDHLTQIPLLLVGFPGTIAGWQHLAVLAKMPHIHYHKQRTRLEVCLVFKWTILISICQEWQRLGKGWGLGRAVSCSMIVERGTGCLNPSHCNVENIGLYNDVRLFNRVPNIARTTPEAMTLVSV
jgi:hypothetical protein